MMATYTYSILGGCLPSGGFQRKTPVDVNNRGFYSRYSPHTISETFSQNKTPPAMMYAPPAMILSFYLRLMLTFSTFLPARPHYKFAELRSMGLINEQIAFKQRFYIPTDEEKGISILADLLKRYPVISDDEEEDLNLDSLESTSAYANQISAVDLTNWLIEPEKTDTTVCKAENEQAAIEESATPARDDIPLNELQPAAEQPKTSTLTEEERYSTMPTIQLALNFSEASPYDRLASDSLAPAA
jgi:hypothetical protein